MAHNLTYSGVLKTARNAATSTTLGSSGKFDVYSGSQPASPDVAVPGGSLKLIETTWTGTMTNTNTGNILTLTLPPDTVGTAAATSGGTTATWGRIYDSAGVAHIDFSVGIDSTFDFVISPDATVKTGIPFSITSLSFTANN